MEPYLYVGNNPIMFTDPTGMIKEGGEGTDNTYRGVWNHCENRYDYELINNDGGDEVDTVHYEGGKMDGKSLAFMVETERTYFNDFREKYHTKETERRPGYRHLLKNTFSGHAIQSVGGIGDPFGFKELFAGIFAEASTELTGSPYVGAVLSLATNKGKVNILNNIKKGNNELPKGFKLTKEFGKSHGQDVYKKGNYYYSKDVDSHNGGVWKMFENKGGRLKRIGTVDKDLNIFKK